MNDSSLSLNNWHALYALSNTMLSLAQSGKWDELIEKEVVYVSLVGQIGNPPLPAGPGGKFIQDKAQALLGKILENEVEMKRLLQERMGELQELMAQTGKQRTLNMAYGNLSGNVLFPGEANEINP